MDSMGGWFYLLVFFIALLEATLIVGTFVPGTIILFFFGFAASQGHTSLFGVICATSIGVIVGDYITYFIGRYGSGFIKEHKGILRMSHVDIGRRFFLKYGGISVLFGRFISPLRQIIPLIAGMVHMTHRRFSYLNIIGGILWSILYVGLGYYFGTRWPFFEKIMSRAEVIIALAILVGALIYIRKSKIEKVKAEALEHKSEHKSRVVAENASKDASTDTSKENLPL